jgi:hypothetical protein
MNEKTKILEELSDLDVSTLLNYKENFKLMSSDVPKDYFSQVAENVLAELEVNLETKTMTSIDIPDAYFQTLPDKVISRINHESTKVRKLSQSTYKWMAAASIVGLLMISTFIFRSQSQPVMSVSNVKIEQEISSSLTDDDVAFIINEYSTQEDLEHIKSINDISVDEFNSESENQDDHQLLKDLMIDDTLDFLNNIM